MAITYEILALRYGILDGGRLQYQNYIIPDDHLAPDPLDFLVFAIRGNGRTIVMDTGFNPVSAARRGRELLRTPAQALLDAGIDPAETKDVILTHMHWDHAGGMEYFPKAMFHLQASEMAYCTGPCMCEPFLKRPFDVDDVKSAVTALYSERLKLHDGTVEIAPGITRASDRRPLRRHPVDPRADRARHRRAGRRCRAHVGQHSPAQPVPGGGRCRADAERLRHHQQPRRRSGPRHSGARSVDPETLSAVTGYPEIVRIDLPPIA